MPGIMLIGKQQDRTEKLIREAPDEKRKSNSTE